MIGPIEKPTHAITLYAPWIWAILHAGKDIENRAPNFQHFRGWVWMHASKLSDRKAREAHENMVASVGHLIPAGAEIPDADLFVRMGGRVAGLVEVTGRVRRSDSPWFVGPAGLTLAERSALPESNWVPARGQLGRWRLPESVLEQLELPR